ncbi:retrovirus-related pol polyprotein from transposon TNT 1-94 [Tanacetum coccineum]
MDDPNITMEEYTQLMAVKARGGDKTFNWETATYNKKSCDDLDSFTDFETDFPAIVYNDALRLNQNVFSETTNIDVKPIDSVIFISSDTTLIEFDENIEINHDTSVLDPVVSAGSPSSTTIDQDAPLKSHSPSSSEVQPPNSHQGVVVGPTIEDNPFAQADNDPFENIFAPELSSAESSSGNVSAVDFNQVIQPHDHLRKWSKDHLMENLIGNPSHLVSTRKQLATDALWCFYNFILSKVKPKNFKFFVTEDCWFEAMQEEIHEFDRLQVWELVLRSDCVMIIALKRIYKVKLDEYGDVPKNKARLVAKGCQQEKGINFEESFAPVAQI